ncbi:hypothetical protein ACWGL0_36170, partial [Streptomyces wedmorensis]
KNDTLVTPSTQASTSESRWRVPNAQHTTPISDDDILAMALHLRSQGLSLRDMAARLVITKGAKKGQRPSPATVMRMLREHDEQAASASTALSG